MKANKNNTEVQEKLSELKTLLENLKSFKKQEKVKEPVEKSHDNIVQDVKAVENQVVEAPPPRQVLSENNPPEDRTKLPVKIIARSRRR